MGTIRVDQTKEVKLFSEQLASLHVRYTYHRAQETQQADDVGQDYLVCRYSDNEIAFCICDGVSLSYYGNIAAKLLGDELTDFLWSLGDSVYTSEDDLRQQLHNYLQNLTDKAKGQIERHVIPNHIQGMLREVLEAKRERGSESTFVCGKIKFSSSNIESVALAWMGDSRVRVWNKEVDTSSQLGGQFLTSERWSTNDGLIGGGPHVFVLDSEHCPIDRIHIYTDGLNAFDTWNKSPNDVELIEMVESSLSKPTSDDIAFLELEVRGNDITS
jgi:hypothetical protein